MKGINSIEKKKLVFFRNLIDSLLSLEEYVMGRDEAVTEVLLQRIEQLYQRTAKEAGKIIAGHELLGALEDMLSLVQNAQEEQDQRTKPEIRQMIPPVGNPERECSGETEVLEPGERAFAETTVLHELMRLPFLVRRNTKEKILINRDVFKMGKEKSYVDYYIENDAVSRSHADIIRKRDCFYVVDRGSLNHTFLEGKRVPPETYVKLESGQSFVLADEEFTFYYEAVTA